MKPLVLALALASALPCAAQETAPDVFEYAWLDFDIASFKVGDWAKYRLVREGEKPLEYKVACVAEEGDNVWIEEDRTTCEYNPGTVILCQVNRKDRMVKRAFWGKPGEAGKELKVARKGAQDPGNDAATGTADTSSVKVTPKDKEIAAEKIVIDTVAPGMSPVKKKQTLVLSPEVPFQLHADDKGICRASIQEGDIKWGTKPTWKGGLVEDTIEGSVNVSRKLIDWGTGAKATLKKP